MRTSLRHGLLPVAALLLVAVWLSPTLHTGFRFDDTFNFEMRTGVFEAQGQTFSGYVYRQIETIFSAGRAQPLGIALSVVPWAFSDAPTLYKLFILALTVAMLFAAYWVLLALGVSRAAALLAVVLTGAFVQFRAYHDPMLGYLGLVQICMLLFLGSVLAWLRHRASGRRAELVLAVLLWLSCLLLYEVAYALAPAYVALIAVRERAVRSALRASLPFVAPVIVGALLLVVLRITDDTVGAYYEPGGGVVAILESWCILVVGAIPGTYALFDPMSIMGSPTSAEIVAACWRGLLAAVIVVVVCVRRPAAGAVLAPLTLGAALCIFGSAPIAVSPKYQDEIALGGAYIPSLIQVLGVGVMASVGVVWLANAAAGWPHVVRAVTVGVAAVVAGTAAGATGLSNLRVVADEQPMLATRNALNDAVRHGLLASLPPDATVVGFARDLGWYPTSYAVSKVAFDGGVADRGGTRLDMRVDQVLPRRACTRRSTRWPRRPCEALSPIGGWMAVRARWGR